MKKLLLVTLFITYTFATVINVPGDQPSIQDGLNSAATEDTVLVATGIYFENLTWPAVYGIKLHGAGEESCFIDGGSLASVIRFEEVLGGIIDSMTVITNFSVRNGYASGNSPLNYGGGIFLHSSSPSIENVTITENIALYGKGIYCEENSNPSLLNVTINGNNLQNMFSQGGGLYLSNSSPSLENVAILENFAAWGGGISCTNNSNPSLINVNISGNVSAWGGGALSGGNSNPTFINSILWNNTPQEININGFSSVTLQYCDLQGGESAIVTNDNSEVFWLTGNIETDPLFDMSGENYWTLTADSPCIDVGTPDTTGLNLPEFDILGNPRIWDGNEDGIAVIDMGAYEYYSQEPVIGDINQDGVIDILDIVQVVQCILGEQIENCGLGDVNEDGIVDVLDVVAMVDLILNT